MTTRINGDGTLAVPGIGRFDIGSQTIADFEAKLAAEIARISGREASVTIEVIDYRPVFISGLVNRSGSFPWRPGLSVLQAETLAGGISRGMTIGDAMLTPTTDRDRDRALRAAYELASTLATVARLKTEKASEDTFVAPTRLSALVTPSDLISISAAQQATLKSRNTAFAVRVAALKSAKVMAQKELGALEAQRVRLSDQLAKRRATLKKIERMADQGFVRADRLFEDQIKISEVEERLTTTTLAIARMDAAAATAQQDLDVLVLGQKAAIDTEILTLDQRAGQLELDIESANDSYRRLTGQEALKSRDAQPSVLRYEIVRAEGGNSQVIKADRGTLLRPGDVLMVSYADKS